MRSGIGFSTEAVLLLLGFAYFAIAPRPAWASVEPHQASPPGAPRSCTLIVTSPNGSESWMVGQGYEITWTSDGCAAQIDIDLFRNEIKCLTIGQNVTNVTGANSFPWTAAQCGGEVFGYKVRIAAAGTEDELGRSYASFSVGIGGACCLMDGSCFVAPEESCDASDGDWQGAEILCAPNPCPQPTGSCCFADGHCTEANHSDCTGAGGLEWTAWSGCDPNPCVPFGACCYLDGHCTFLAEAGCSAEGEAWQGALTTCDPNACPIPTGRCCFSDNHCAELTLIECNNQGGFNWAPYAGCDPNPCGAIGACCFEDGACRVMTEDECYAQSGSYLGNTLTCVPNNCPQPQVCCFPSSDTPICEDLQAPICISRNGIPEGLGTTCATYSCPLSTGSCCFPDDGHCEVLTWPACRVTLHIYWQMGGTCDPNPCEPPQACCLPDGRCWFYPPVVCQAYGSTPEGVGTTCDTYTCPQTPTRSTSWGRIKGMFR